MILGQLAKASSGRVRGLRTSFILLLARDCE